jgi:hypothetical protein
MNERERKINQFEMTICRLDAITDKVSSVCDLLDGCSGVIFIDRGHKFGGDVIGNCGRIDEEVRLLLEKAEKLSNELGTDMLGKFGCRVIHAVLACWCEAKTKLQRIESMASKVIEIEKSIANLLCDVREDMIEKYGPDWEQNEENDNDC